MTSYTALATSFETIATVNTCSNLRLRERPGAQHRFYPACRLGTVQQRWEWVALVSTKRLDRVRGLQEELAEATASQVAKLFQAKSAQLRGGRSMQDVEAAHAAIAGYMTVAEAVLHRRADLLDEVGLPVATTIDLLRRVLDLWVESSSIEPPQIPEDLLEGLSPAARALVAPQTG